MPVIGNTSDPATPYEGAVAMTEEPARASDYGAGYLIWGTLPPPETVCQQDRRTFAKTPTP